MSSFQIYSPPPQQNETQHDNQSKKNQKANRSSRLPLSPLNANASASFELKSRGGTTKRSLSETGTTSPPPVTTKPSSPKHSANHEISFDLPHLTKQNLKEISNDCPQQQHLRNSCCSLYCLEVVSSAILRDLKEAAKTKQSQFQRRKSTESIAQMKLVRAALSSCESNVWNACLKARRVRKEELAVERQMDREQRKQNRREERRILRAEALEERQQRREAKVAARETQLRQAKNNFPRNREMWSEIGYLMTSLNELEQVEAMWKNATFDHMISSSVKAPLEKETDEAETNSHGTTVNEVQNEVDDITIALDRINEALESVNTVMHESDKVRKELFDTYRLGHKFNGYMGVKNPKALVRAFALG